MPAGRMIVSVLGAVSVLGMGGIAAANDASYAGDGATVFAFHESRVRMERERVLIRPVARQEGEVAHPGRWEADCTFDLVNLTAEPVTVQAGFPDWRAWGDFGGRERPWAIRDFRVEVDGKPVEPTHKDVSPPKTGEFRHDGAWTWPVAIPPRGKVVVRNTYRFGGLSTNGPYAACAGERPHRDARLAFWRRAARPKDGWDFENGVCEVVTYVVTTARTWAGTVGNAEITVELPPSVPPHLFVPVPAATEVRDNRVTWRFSNWTPRRELSVILLHPIPDGELARLPAFDTAGQARAWVAFARANGVDAATARRLAAWTEAARARRHDDPAVAAFVETHRHLLEGARVPPPAPARESARIREVLDAYAGGVRR